MKTIWFKGARTEKDKEERRLWIISGANAFKVLTGILGDKIASKESDRNQEERLELPSYSEYQAYASGYIRAMQEVQSLLDLGTTDD